MLPLYWRDFVNRDKSIFRGDESCHRGTAVPARVMRLEVKIGMQADHQSLHFRQLRTSMCSRWWQCPHDRYVFCVGTQPCGVM